MRAWNIPFDRSANKPQMNLHKNHEPRGRLLDTEKDRRSRQPPHSHKASASSPDPLLAKSKIWGSIANNYPRNRTATTTSLPSDAYLNFTVSNEKPAARETQRLSSSGSVIPHPERVESLAKTLIARGSRLLKRQNSKIDSVSLRTLEWLERSGTNMGKHKSQPPDLHPEYRRESMYSTGNDTDIRRHISEPYNFQHLTHTNATQFQAIHKTSHSELKSEFSAIRASQIPRRHLQGIKAESLQSRTPSEASSGSSSPVHDRHASTSQLSPRTPEGEPLDGSHITLGSLPYPRSVENFSQPSPKSYKPRPSPITPPPRMSSKKKGPELLPAHDGSLNSPSLHSHPASIGSAASDTSPLTRVTTAYGGDWEDDFFDYSTTPHAVSTPDMTAFTLKPLLFGNLEKELPGLPEEYEVSFDENNPRPSSSAFQPRLNLHPAKSFPSTKTSSRRWSRTSSRVSPDGLISPLLDGPPLAEAVIPSIDQPFDDIPFGPRLSRQISSDLDKYDECWEDDIDYCYEHNAEADCDFDWDRISSEDEKTAVPPNDADLEVDRSPSSPDHPKADGKIASPNSCDSELGADRPLPFYLPPLQLSSTESSLSSRDSSKSSALSINGPLTPSRSILSPQLNLPFRTAKDTRLSPVFISRDFESQFIQEEVYQRLLAGDHASEQVYPFHHINFDTTSSKDDSPRSSHSQMSKCASQESFVLAQPTSGCHHRDNESVGSVPELVHSRWNSQSSDLAINRSEGVVASSLAATPVLRNHPDKPLPLRPILDESQPQEAVRKSVVPPGILCNRTPIGPDDQSLVAPRSRVSQKIKRDRVFSDAAVRFLGDFPAAIATSPRRVRSTNSISVQPAQPASRTGTPSTVYLSVPF